jgi:indolepyruvate ferredoxin oxidoreductase
MNKLLVADEKQPIHYAQRSLDDIMEHRIALLTEYQSAAYAGRYKDLVMRVKEAEEKLGGSDYALTKAIAHNYAKVLSYKDEYEVARLHTSKAAKQRLKDEFAKGAKPSFHFAPPFLARKDKITGEPQKMKFGAWIVPVLNVMKRFKFLRGSWFDPFAYSADRKLERQIIEDFESDVNLIVTNLNKMTGNHALNLAKIPEDIRGFGYIKEQCYESVQQKRKTLRNVFLNAHSSASKTNAKSVPDFKMPVPSA